jgi:outer membrane autotransporter protein
VGGKYTNHADGTYVTEIGGLDPGVTADNVSANTANIQGGTLRVVHLDNFMPFLNDRVSVVSTTNGLTGGFTTLDPVGWVGLIQPFEDDTANSVDVVFLLAQSFASQGHTPNQIAAAADCIPLAIRFLGNISPIGPTLRSDYDLIAPEELASIYEVSFTSSTVQTQNLQRRMNDIRDGSFGFCADGFAIRDEHGLAKSDGKGSKEVIEQVAPPSDRWGVFITGTGDLARTSGTYNADGYQLNQGGFTMGADYRVTHNFAIGIDGGYTKTRADLNNNGRLDADSGKLGIYATFFTDGGFYVDGTATGGWNTFDTRRSALLGQEGGSTDGAEFTGSIAAGYDWKRGCWKFGPIASFEYNYAEFDAFTEGDTSLIPLHFPDQNQDAERSNVGLRISHQQNYKGNGCNVISEVRAYWRHDYGDDAYAIDSNFVGCDDVFTVHGPGMGRDSALIDAGLTILCTRHLSAYFYYDGQYGRDNYYVNAVSGGFHLAF